MSCFTRHICRVLAAVAYLFAATGAYADKPLNGFIPLHGKHTDIRGKTMPSMRNAPAQFMPLTARNFRALPLARRDRPIEDADPAELSEHFSHAAAAPSAMTPEQAQQIISIFAPDH